MDYSDTTGINPDITRAYDNSTSGAYGKGKFYYSYAGGNETTGATVEYRAIDTYDALGRPLTHRQRFKTSSSWASAFTTSQSYNLAGAITGQTYPSGHTTSYTYYDSTAGDKKPVGSLVTFSGYLGDGTNRTYADSLLKFSRLSFISRISRSLFSALLHGSDLFRRHHHKDELPILAGDDHAANELRRGLVGESQTISRTLER